ncbi:hypothetical protein AHF37_04365 [Paragonimus kellicotti]|nr:hypothetical protein AHF37_04365 [Paragonimus kellicotti]
MSILHVSWTGTCGFVLLVCDIAFVFCDACSVALLLVVVRVFVAARFVLCRFDGSALQCRCVAVGSW